MVYTIDVERSLDHKTSDENVQHNNLCATYLRKKYKKTFNFYRFFGLVLVEYDYNEGCYKPQNAEFVKKYIFNYLCIMMFIGIGIVVSMFVPSDFDCFRKDNSMFIISMFMCCVSVVPFIQLYCMRLLLEFGPETMMKMAKISLALRNTETELNQPMKVAISPVVHSSSKIKEENSENEGQRNWILYLPMACICLALFIFFGLLLVGLVFVVEPYTFLEQLPTFCLQFALLYFPFLLTLVCITVMDCCRSAYCIINNITENVFEKVKKNPKNENETKMFIAGLRDVHLKLKQTGDLVEFIEDNILKYLHSICLLAYLVSSLLSCVKIMNSIESLLHVFPFIESFYMTAVLCCQAEHASEQVIWRNKNTAATSLKC